MKATPVLGTGGVRTGANWCPLRCNVVDMDHSIDTTRWSPQLVRDLGSPGASTASAALDLAAHGIPVFPCAPGEKHPLTTHGFHDATTDLGAVSRWWSRWPEANLGIPTGAASGIDVVDVDVHPSGSGFEAFGKAQRAGLVADWAWQVRTPSGGLHAYFLRWHGQEHRSWQLPGHHLDFRGDGGYVIAPPSRVVVADGNEHHYELIAVASHRPLSIDGTALRNFLEPPGRHGPPPDLPMAGARPDKLAAWVANRPEGDRNGGLFWAACRMVESNYPFQTAAAVLGEAAEHAGLSDREAAATIRSAYRIASRLGPVSSAGPTRAAEAVRL